MAWKSGLRVPLLPLGSSCPMQTILLSVLVVFVSPLPKVKAQIFKKSTPNYCTWSRQWGSRRLRHPNHARRQRRSCSPASCRRPSAGEGPVTKNPTQRGRTGAWQRARKKQWGQPWTERAAQRQPARPLGPLVDFSIVAKLTKEKWVKLKKKVSEKLCKIQVLPKRKRKLNMRYCSNMVFLCKNIFSYKL